MTTEPLAPPTEPGPDTGIEGNQTDIDHNSPGTRRDDRGIVGEGRRHRCDEGEGGRGHGPHHRKDEPTKNIVENAHTAQSTARDSHTFRVSSFKTSALIAPLIATAAVAVGVVKWRRRR